MAKITPEFTNIKKQENCALILMYQICPILCDDCETEVHTEP